MIGRQRASCPGIQLGQRAATISRAAAGGGSPPVPAFLLATLSGRFEFMLGSEALDNTTDATIEESSHS